MTGGARAAEREPRRGRHRRGSGESTWTPVVTGRRARAGVTAELPRVLAQRVPGPREPVAPVAYAWPETPPSGLRKFDLGTIPASVTPPSTWRRAAWFAVGTAVFVVLALGFAAFRLVGNPRKSTTIDALPGQPSQQLLITDVPVGDGSPTNSVTPTTTRPSVSRTSTRAPAPAPGRTAGVRPGSGGTGTIRPVQPDQDTSTAPPRSTVDGVPTPPANPEQLGDRTEQYYAQVVEHPEAAYQLTAGAMRAEGPEGIEQRYGDVQSIEVKEITIDPNWSYTRSRLTIVREDGSTVTVERELTFSPGPNPKITSDTAA